MKYSLMRLAHFSGGILQRRLYLDLRETSPMQVLDSVEILLPKARPTIPEMADLI